MIKKYKDLIIAITCSMFLILMVLFFGQKTVDKPVDNFEEEVFGGVKDNSKWIVIDKFDGYQTRLDSSKVSDGANPQGQNTTSNNGDRVSLRKFGYELFPTGTASTNTNEIKSLHTFRKRDGTNIMMRSHSTVLEWFEEANDTWETLVSGATSEQEYGFSDYNINTDLTSYVYFGNAVENWSRWTGATTLINGALSGGEGTITVDSTTGFDVSGTIIYCGTEIAYSGKAATTFTVSSAHACADNRGVAQAPDTDASDPKGNLYINSENRIFISGITAEPQAVYFSAYGDATDYVGATLIAAGTDTSPGIFNLGEGGGGVTGIVQDENSIYFFKRSIIYKATLDDSNYTINTLKPFDGKSQTLGVENQGSVFTGGNQVFIVTPDKQIMSLTRVKNIDVPKIIAISNVIKPTVDDMVFDDFQGIVFGDKAYFAAKTNSDSVDNDVVLVWNIETQTWDSPIVGWNVNHWTIYDDGNGNGDDLYFGDSITENTYQVTNIPTDDIFEVKSNWRSKQFNFGLPQTQKEISNVYVEGYISDNTTLNISLLLDEDGFTQTATTAFVGTETTYIYDSSEFNLFGLSEFGTKRFGGQEDLSGKKKFRVYLNKSLRLDPFYNAQIEFASEGENQQWEITAFGFFVREYNQPVRRQLFRTFQ